MLLCLKNIDLFSFFRQKDKSKHILFFHKGLAFTL